MAEEAKQGRSTSFRKKRKSSTREPGRKSKSEADLRGSKVKGLFRGLSRKGKKKSADGDESIAAETTVSVHAMEEKAQGSLPSSPAPAETETSTPPEEELMSLKLVLLLMDPNTRRFELLQLEFDSKDARVSDIIAQIPMSVTETAIKEQVYEGVLDASGDKHSEDQHLVEFCDGKKILVALPKDLPESECVRLARPILSDEQVVTMLTGSGFDVTGWKKAKSTPAPTAPPTVNRTVPGVVSAEIEKEATSSDDKNGSIFPTIVILAIFAIVLQTIHNAISAPIEVGAPLGPYSWRSKCGLMGLLPAGVVSRCTNSYLKVNDDGTVAVYDENDELDLLMVGGVCKKEDCIDGILQDEDGIVYIGGKRVKSASSSNEVYMKSLSPWPFKEEPLIKVRK